MQRHILSKSTFLKGLQCHKALYLYNNNKQLRDPISNQQQAIFDQGTDVGILAQDLFPGGIDCSPEKFWNSQESVVKTHKAIADGHTIIYEAAFQFNGVLALLDILVKDKEGWKAYEVKSSTSVSETYELDATIQFYVITNSGIDLKDVSIVHIDNTYIKNGPIEVEKLFHIESVKGRVDELMPSVPRQVSILKEVLRQDTVPEVEIGSHCSTPYHCDFRGHCWKHVPEYSVFNISRIGQKSWDLYNQGIVETTEIPDDYPLSTSQQIQIERDRNQERIIDQSAVSEFIGTLKYPLAHIDFETFQSAVPLYDGTRPYQQLCFQWSAHIEEGHGGEIKHLEFLGKEGLDPRIEFVSSLIEAMKSVKTILVYNIGFERGRLNELSEQFPQFSAGLQSIIDRMDDLMIPFQQKSVYYPEMRGSYSIKKVLPALVPELSYSTLNIQEGGTASSTYANLHKEEDPAKVKQVRKDLLDYCEMDTYAMVKILEKLYDLI